VLVWELVLEVDEWDSSWWRPRRRDAPVVDVLVVLEEVLGVELGAALDAALDVVVLEDEVAGAVELDELPPPQPAAPRISAAQIAASTDGARELTRPCLAGHPLVRFERRFCRACLPPPTRAP
jgi:hypothetical protein